MNKDIEDLVTSVNEHALFADGFDEAFIGIALRAGQSSVVSYDYWKCIEILCREMTIEEAIEHFEFNVLNSYMGEHTPIFIVTAGDE